MSRLIKAEFYKLKKLHYFHIIFLLIIVVLMENIYTPYTGYEVYTFSLIPELYDVILISIFTSAFVCTEFSNRTYGNTLYCGTSRQNIFLAKLAVYFLFLLVLILVTPITSTSVATIRNGFGADWDTIALESISKFIFYTFERFFMAGITILVASIIQNTIGTFGLSVAVIYLIILMQNPVAQDTFNILIINSIIISMIKAAILISAATLIFTRRDFK